MSGHDGAAMNVRSTTRDRSTPRRGLSRVEAALYVGISPSNTNPHND
jgi:hypothetical protein